MAHQHCWKRCSCRPSQPCSRFLSLLTGRRSLAVIRANLGSQSIVVECAAAIIYGLVIFQAQNVVNIHTFPSVSLQFPRQCKVKMSPLFLAHSHDPLNTFRCKHTRRPSWRDRRMSLLDLGKSSHAAAFVILFIFPAYKRGGKIIIYIFEQDLENIYSFMEKQFMSRNLNKIVVL